MAKRPREQSTRPAPVVEPAVVVSEPYYVVARRPMQHQGRLHDVGERLEGIETAPRLESWLRAGLIEKRDT